MSGSSGKDDDNHRGEDTPEERQAAGPSPAEPGAEPDRSSSTDARPEEHDATLPGAGTATEDDPAAARGSEADAVPEADTPGGAGGGAGTPPPPAGAPGRRRGGFLALFLGGVVAAVIGFLLAFYVFPDRFGGQSAETAGAIDDLSGRLAAVSDRAESGAGDLEDLRGRVGKLADGQQALRDDLPDGAALSDRIDKLESTLSGRIDSLGNDLADQTNAAMGKITDRVNTLAGRVDDIDSRLSTLEKGPLAQAEASAEAAKAYERDLDEMRGEVDKLKGELTRRGDEVSARLDKVASEAEQARQGLSDAAGKARQRIADAADSATAEVEQAKAEAAKLTTDAVLNRIDSALETGAPFDAALARLGDVEVPDALSSVAASGVATMTELRESFPEAARKALAASRRGEAEGGAADRFTAFLKNQVGARSLTAKEGDSADAVLSRAQAALRGGDIEAALSEIGALPEKGRQALSEWTARAKARRAARKAAGTLAGRLDQA